MRLFNYKYILREAVKKPVKIIERNGLVKEESKRIHRIKTVSALFVLSKCYLISALQGGMHAAKT